MRTAIVSDLHLGLAAGGDVLRDPEFRALLLERLADAERVVLLGDVVELRDLPVGPALAASRPFFEELGAALGEVEVTLVPGNHDHRFAEALLDQRSIAGAGPLGLEQTADPSPGPLTMIDEWLGRARLRIAYPGLWLREDVYATHGHYCDAHLRLPRAECVAVATVSRFAGPVPDPATPADYERRVRPIYGLGYGIAQARSAPVARSQGNASEAAWEVLSGQANGGGPARRARRAAIRRGFPLAIRGLNRLLRAEFEPDIDPAAIFSGGIEAVAEMARRLGVDGGHVIYGHTHRGGPLPGEAEWELPGGGRLHNTGSWVFASIFHHPGEPPSPYWPGTLTWLEDEGPPRRETLLRDHDHAAMMDLVRRNRRALAG
ncbi:MAG TPA: metallophosphoesterase [Solirubrobacterales bacterium]|jgi:predicted phosphodiesterase